MVYIIALLVIASFDVLCGFALFLLWKYLDIKYFSISEIEQLKEENEFLKKENKKVNGSSSDFYGKDFDKL